LQNKPLKWQDDGKLVVFTFEKPQKKNKYKKGGGADNIIAELQTFSLTENKQRILLYALVVLFLFFIIVTEVANAVRLGVYVMRMSASDYEGPALPDLVTDRAISVYK